MFGALLPHCVMGKDEENQIFKTETKNDVSLKIE
jgi:hypothetical protein